MNPKEFLPLALLLFLFATFHSFALASTPKELPPVPETFTHIIIPSETEVGEIITKYLWYHLYHRLGNGPTIFNKEYLLLADMWVNGFTDPHINKPIQEVHREDLLSIQIDDEGYINTHQHFSHAHDWGWPFPIWTQVKDQTDKGIGWHFQPLEKVPGWVGDELRKRKMELACGDQAVQQWKLHNYKSHGISENAWKLEVIGNSPTLTSPEGLNLSAEYIPFFQIRWKTDGIETRQGLPYIEWRRDNDTDFSPERRFYFYYESSHLSQPGWAHSHIPLYTHPQWKGKIDQIRFSLVPGANSGIIHIDSIFSAFDTRHTINNPIYIMACRLYFNWSGDIEFLRKVINKMRMALLYQRKEMQVDKYHCIVNPWVGHDGITGLQRENDKKMVNIGHGIGNNYWDLLPFGGMDCYATNQYYSAVLTMAEIEEAIINHPEWNIPRGALALDPTELREHAKKIREKTTSLFWDMGKRRFVACIDRTGTSHDYGFIFLNLDAIWYDIALPEQAIDIMDWITGQRLIEGDTSQGKDIYRWQFGPRSTTKRNLDWYVFCWTNPENNPWGYQVQDGGAVLGFTFFDLWARLKILGSDNAWARLKEIIQWEKEVQANGGYRNYYESVNKENTLQGCGTPGGLGIDCEFFESSLLPAIFVYGFMGITPKPDQLEITPQIPKEINILRIENLKYRQSILSIEAVKNDQQVQVRMNVHEIDSFNPITIRVLWQEETTRNIISDKTQLISLPGVYTF